jgi:hypothetical protein
MKFNIMALGITCGVIWGGAILLAGVANTIWPGYGQAFLDVVASVYPGYKGTPGIGQAIIGALYGLVDGGIAGLIFAWLYNFVSSKTAAA